MIRRALFQIHSYLGISIGFVLALMGITGAIMAFDDEIMAAMSPGIVSVPASTATPLMPDALLQKVHEQRPGWRVQRLQLPLQPGDAAYLRMVEQGGAHARERSYVDPYSGRLLGEARGQEFFGFVERLHRWLALPGGPNGLGRTVTGIAALSLVFFAVSGLYLRFPRRPLDWRVWLTLDLRKRGQHLVHALHLVVGTWVLLFYLGFALTGLWWSYASYRSGVTWLLTGQTRHGVERPRGAAPEAEASLDPAWRGFLALAGHDYRQATISLDGASAGIRIAALPASARFDRMTDDFSFDAVSGALLSQDRYADRPLGQIIASNILPIHRGTFFGRPGQIVMMLAAAAMPLFTVTGLLLYLGRRRKRRALSAEAPPAAPAVEPRWLVVHASQTGRAEALARRTAKLLNAAGQPARLLGIDKLNAAGLQAVPRLLLVASTCGEGEAPDVARGFARRLREGKLDAHGLEFAVLALGDRQYPDFCAFGRALDHDLQAHGGTRLFDRVDMDGEDAAAWTEWTQALQQSGLAVSADDQDERGGAVLDGFSTWRLAERRTLNPGSTGAPAVHLALVSAPGVSADWQAGDIAEIRPLNDPAAVTAWLHAAGHDALAILSDGSRLGDRLEACVLPDAEQIRGLSMAALEARLQPLPLRSYSIASIPADGRLDLLVRQVRRADGSLGLGSGWLTQHLPEGAPLQLRIRSNPGFRLASAVHPAPLLLIGNGTGMAGLRAHLRDRAQRGLGGHWLLFGERNAAIDDYYADELSAWLADGTLGRIDRAWSRDGDCGRYVQHLIEAAATEVRAFVGAGATVLVCGSLAGMAAAVDQALRDVLGEDHIDRLHDSGRYRRDVY